MEYFRTEDGQIKADFARRLGVILKQYHEQIISIEKYEVSLTLSILQSLLTNCVELLNGMKNSDKKNNPFYQFPIDSQVWGFDDKSIKYNSFLQNQLTIEKILRHIRNALCHPTCININSYHKTTGYITKGGNILIKTLHFVSSPDINGKGNPKTYKTAEIATTFLRQQPDFPKNIQVIQFGHEKFGYQLNGKPFYRIFEIELCPDQLFTFTYSLASYLSHPLIKKWDGITFQIKKIAA